MTQMARSLVAVVRGGAPPSLQTKASLKLIFSSFGAARPNLFLFSNNPRCHPCHLRFSFRVICSCNNENGRHIDISEYKAAFAKRMAMGGLMPHHRIAVGVSGGPDSMALCLLAAMWKRDGQQKNSAANDGTGFVDGILGIVVDHALRPESGDEAKLVSDRVENMGVKCEVVRCEWTDGRPKVGHLQEAARDKRYDLLQKVSLHHKIGVLLIAHHADDQAELFILRLSRGSGVLGLAGMAFTSQLFPKWINHSPESVPGHGMLLVRPLLEFSKNDMYKICQGGNQQWVEDPTNQSQLFTRNRIRKFLDSRSSAVFSAELQALISVCRRTRLLVDKICSKLISDAVIFMPQGYAEIDLETVNKSDVDDICLLKFFNLVLQFICQRNRHVRRSASKMLLDYIHTIPCKNCLTVAGCYLCPAPGSKGCKVLVCPSFDPCIPLHMEMIPSQSFEGHSDSISDVVERIVEKGKSNTDKYVGGVEENHFLHLTSSKSVVDEGKRLGILSEATYTSITSLYEHEGELFRSKKHSDSDSNFDSEEVVKPVDRFSCGTISPGQAGYFMNRFLLEWNFSKKIQRKISSINENGLETERVPHCSCCGVVDGDNVAKVRHMVDADWLYLAELSRLEQPSMESCTKKLHSGSEEKQSMKREDSCLEFVRLSAQKALASLKQIPVGARRGLPVLVNCEGLLLSIPSICFQHCPNFTSTAVFKPKVPLAGGYTSFL